MTRAIYVVGPPGVGKTSAVDRLIRSTHDRLPAVRTGHGPLRVEPLVRRASGVVDGVHLGRGRPGGFGGTDALSMGVHPAALAWAMNADLPDLVIGEGQRLGTATFLTTLAARADLTVIWLDADPETLAVRCEDRGSRQNEAWRKGSATKAARAATAAQEAGVDVRRFDTTNVWPDLLEVV